MPEYPTNPKYTAMHYHDLARLIKEATLADLDHETLVEAKRRIAERLADHLAKDNSQFDRKKFLEACGVEGEHSG